jgi:hypothetical protein
VKLGESRAEATGMEPASMETTTTAETSTGASMEPTMEPSTVKTSASAAMEPATAVASTPTPAMPISVGKIWLAERGKTQQSGGCGAQSLSDPRSASTLAYLFHRPLLLHRPRIGACDVRTRPSRLQCVDPTA